MADSPMDGDGGQPQMSDLAEEPAKVLRIGIMSRHLLEEIRRGEPGEEGRRRVQQAQQGAVTELQRALVPELSEELARIWRPFASDSLLSETELRLAQAELVGWLEGVFQGIQAALAAQQMGLRGQLTRLRQGVTGTPQNPDERQDGGGRYL